MFENRDRSLVMNWTCHLGKGMVKEAEGLCRASTGCELWCYLVKRWRLKAREAFVRAGKTMISILERLSVRL